MLRSEIRSATSLLPLINAYSRYAKLGYQDPKVRLTLTFAGALVKTGLKLSPSRHGSAKHDFLVLSPTVSWHKRIEGFVQQLCRLWPNTTHIVVPPLRRILSERRWVRPTYPVSARWALLAGYAAYLVEKYRPKVILTFTETDLLSFFLKLEAERRNIIVVNIAHAVLTQSHLKSMFCFDYYFVYGPSSINNARLHPVRFGSTNLVEAGSITISSGDTLAPNCDRKTAVFFSTFLYGGKDDYSRHFDAEAFKSINLVAAWIKRAKHFRLLVKLHPEEPAGLVERIFAGMENVTILPRDTRISDALQPASIAMGIMTNASIEAALMNRPYVDVFADDFCENYLDIETFFGRRVHTLEALESKVGDVYAHYDLALENCGKFVDHHLAHRGGASDYILACLDEIRRGVVMFPSTCLREHVDALSD